MPPTGPHSENAQARLYRTLLLAYLGYGLLGIAGRLLGMLTPEGFLAWALSVVALGAGIVLVALWLFSALHRRGDASRAAVHRPFRSLHPLG
jgi:hypothetical protein